MVLYAVNLIRKNSVPETGNFDKKTNWSQAWEKSFLVLEDGILRFTPLSLSTSNLLTRNDEECVSMRDVAAVRTEVISVFLINFCNICTYRQFTMKLS